MAQIANTASTYNLVGIREDLSDVIYNIDNATTPFFGMAAKAKASATLHEWQTDSLAGAGDNAHIEGDETVYQPSAPTARLGNYCQILKKNAIISGTHEAVNKAGRGKEMAYQVVKKTKEIKKDLERALLANQARVAGSDIAARRLAGVPAWITTNTSAGATGVDPLGNGTNARTDGTQRAFTETLLKSTLAKVWDAGGEPDTIMVGSFNKQVFSTFTGGATKFDRTEDKKLTATVDVYVSDFGTLTVVPNAQQRARDAFILQKDMWAVAMLRPLRNEERAKTGDAEKRELLMECTLESRNQRASGIIADLTTA